MDTINEIRLRQAGWEHCCERCQTWTHPQIKGPWPHDALVRSSIRWWRCLFRPTSITKRCCNGVLDARIADSPDEPAERNKDASSVCSRHQSVAGVVNRLLREALVEEVQLPSPYKTRPGLVPHLRITLAGLDIQKTTQ